eukprot:Gb_15467 [translate_table: standard]
MENLRTLYKMDTRILGTKIIAETAIALGVSSIIFKGIDNHYSEHLPFRPKSFFSFTDRYRRTGECPFYCFLSRYKDEILWATFWFHKATSSKKYSQYILDKVVTTNINEFSGDLKYVGIQILLSNLYDDEDYQAQGHKIQEEISMCSVLLANPSSSIYTTTRGL